MSALDRFSRPIVSGLTATTAGNPLTPARRAQLDADLSGLAEARRRALVESQTYGLRGVVPTIDQVVKNDYRPVMTRGELLATLDAVRRTLYGL